MIDQAGFVPQAEGGHHHHRRTEHRLVRLQLGFGGASAPMAPPHCRWPGGPWSKLTSACELFIEGILLPLRATREQGTHTKIRPRWGARRG